MIWSTCGKGLKNCWWLFDAWVVWDVLMSLFSRCSSAAETLIVKPPSSQRAKAASVFTLASEHGVPLRFLWWPMIHTIINYYAVMMSPLTIAHSLLCYLHPQKLPFLLYEYIWQIMADPYTADHLTMKHWWLTIDRVGGAATVNPTLKTEPSA